MDGRGTDAENFNHKKTKRNNGNIELPTSEDRIERSKGSISTFGISKDIKFPSNSKTSTHSPDSGIFTDPAKKIVLESSYELLFGEGGFKILESMDSSQPVEKVHKTGELSYEQVLKRLERYEFVQEGRNSITFTDKGQEFYDNWSGFQNYLSSKDRIDNVEEELENATKTEKKLAEFMNETADISIGMSDLFSQRDRQMEKKRWQRNYSSENEFYEITAVLYDSEDQVFQSLDALEAVKNAEEIGETQAAKFNNAGTRGLLSQEGVNSTGEKLYRKVLRDYMFS